MRSGADVNIFRLCQVYCRRTRQAFMVRVPNRRINVIDYLLKKYIELGSILVTDSARVYENVPAR